MRLANMTALVTGAAGGFGVAIASRCADEGATVVMADIDGDGLELAAKRVREHGPAFPVTVDLTDPDAVASLFGQIDQQHGPLDVLVNNAGCVVRSPLKFHGDADWHRVLTVNLDSVFYCARAAVHRMIPRRSGRIVNISSVLAVTGGADEIAYATAKAGVLGFTRSLAQEVGRRGIRVNALCPTLADTGVSREYFTGLGVAPGAVAAFLARRSGMSRALRPEDVADAAVYLAAPDSDYINGQSIVLGAATCAI